MDKLNSYYGTTNNTYQSENINRQNAFKNGLKKAKILLTSFVRKIDKYWDDENSTNCNLSSLNNLEKIELICNNFHRVAQQMRSRYSNRSTLEIKDEYDVQDLFHYQLISHGFEDIRKEEWTPSYAGSCSRTDFLLKPEKTVIEIKKTREGLKNKKLGEELIIDIHKYQTHPDCKTLICFVYDPEGKISNPRGLERDLEQVSQKIEVKVFIRSS